MEGKSNKNFHQVHEDRNISRRETNNIRKEKDGGNFALRKVLEEVLSEKEEEHRQFKVEDYGGITGAKEKIAQDKEEFLNKGPNIEAIKSEQGAQFTKVYNLRQNQLNLLNQQFVYIIKAQENPNSQVYQSLIKTINTELSKVDQEYQKERMEDPALVHAVELVNYKTQLASEGHIAITPQTQKDLEKIGDAIAVGRPMFLYGPTGTGKTSLARYAAEHYTNKPAEMIYCNPQFRETTAYGKTGLKTNKQGQTETIDIEGPLTRAITGGKVVVFDEFTSLPQEQMVFIKGILNARPGDKVNIPNNGQKIVAPGFQIILTANLKSDKNKERAGIPPESANEYAPTSLEIKYSRAEEGYDIALSRLMNDKGEINLSKYDLEEVLPNLMKVMSEIQEMYSGQIPDDAKNIPQISSATGKVKGLEKLVLNQRTIAIMVDKWKLGELKGNNKSFLEFVDDELVQNISFKEYSPGDIKLASSWLAIRGFLQTKTEQDIGLTKGELKGLQNVNSQDLKKQISKSNERQSFTLKEIARFDPFQIHNLSHAFENEIPDEFVEKMAEKRNSEIEKSQDTITTPEQFQELITAVNPKDYLNSSIMENIESILPLTIEKDLSKYDGHRFGTETYDTIDKVQEAMKKEGYHPANLAELLYWIKEKEVDENITDKNVVINGKEYNKYYWLCADEGSVLSVGSSQEVAGWSRGDGRRKLGLDGREGEWDDDGFFLAVRD